MHVPETLTPVLSIASLLVPTLPPPFNRAEPDYSPHPLPLPATVIHQFPAGTWLENLAVRRNGRILTTALSSPEVFQVDDRGIDPVKVVHTFANATSCTGITKLGRDVFYIIAGNFSLSTFSAVPGSWSVYKVSVHHKSKPAKVSLVAHFPDSVMLSGITVLSKHRKWLLVSDSAAGVVYRLEAKTGKVVRVLEDPLMKPERDSPSFVTGVKGIKTLYGYLYFSNPSRNIIARIPIKHGGTSKTSASVITQIDDPEGFVFSELKNIFVAQNRVDLLARVINDKHYTVATIDTLANGTEGKLFGPTAVRFGKVGPTMDAIKEDWRRIFISTNGGTAQYLTGNATRGGTISLVDVRGFP
ncbi:hypothetical protein MMC22_008804 [Lobaria immixta]|nr:hypothetical protein [Lobaria immixta]